MTARIRVYALRLRNAGEPWGEWHYFASLVCRDAAAKDAIDRGQVAWSQDLEMSPTAGDLIRLLDWAQRQAS